MSVSNRCHFTGAVAAVALALGLGWASASAEDKIAIGFVTHAQGDPFVQQIIDGAQAAASDLGVTLSTAAQSGGAPEGQFKLVQNFANSGVQGGRDISARRIHGEGT